MKIAALTLLAAIGPAALAAEAPALTAPPSIGFSVLRMIGALCLVFSLLFGGLWAYKNSARFAPGRRDAKLKVLESRALGHRHSIFVVGYNEQRILLATSPTGVTMLTHLPEGSAEPEVIAESSPSPALPNFATAFSQALQTLRK